MNDIGTRATRVLLGALLVAAFGAAPAAGQQDAQGPDCGVTGAPCRAHPDRMEISVLGGVVGGSDLGSTNANLLSNQVPTGGQSSLFTARTALSQAPVVEGRVGVRLVRGLFIEGGVSYARPEFSVDLSADVEGAPNVTATSRLTQVVGDVGLQYRWRGRRVSPFVMGGGGYLRQLDEPRTTAETGWMAYGGAGLVVRLSDRPGFWSHVAVRGDARVLWLRDGIILDDQRGPTYQATAGLVVGF